MLLNPNKNQMEKQSTLAYNVKKVVPSSLGLFGILREAFKTSIRNGRLLLFITIIMFSYYSMMGLADRFVLLPRLEDLVANSKLLPKNGSVFDADTELFRAVMKDVRFFLTYEFVVLSVLGLISMFAAAASVHSSFEAYTAKVLSLKEMLLGTKGRWKRALTTSVWMIIISLASAALLFFVFGVIKVMTEGSVSSALNLTLIVLGVCYAVYLCSLWMLGLVVAVMEENLSGLKAITQANELMKGKKLRGIVLMAIMMFAGWAISQAFYFLETVTTPANAKLAVVVSLAIRIPNNLSYCVLKLFAFVVYTLFYHECKKSQAVEENASLYAPIAAVAEF